MIRVRNNEEKKTFGEGRRPMYGITNMKGSIFIT